MLQQNASLHDAAAAQAGGLLRIHSLHGCLHLCTLETLRHLLIASRDETSMQHPELRRMHSGMGVP